MTSFSTRPLSILFLSLLLSFIALTANGESSELFVVLTSADSETQMMALVLATQSMNQDVPVRILLCSDAGDLAIAGTESPAFAPANRSPKQLLTTLLDRGVRVDVCGIYLPNREYSDLDLIDGIGIASPPEVAMYMKNPAVRYFSF